MVEDFAGRGKVEDAEVVDNLEEGRDVSSEGKMAQGTRIIWEDDWCYEPKRLEG